MARSSRPPCRPGRCEAALPSIPVPAARQALLSAYHVGFSTTLNHLMIIGAIVAFVGAVCGFALVRQRDFVVPDRAARRAVRRGAPGVPRRPADAAVPAVHA